MAVHAAAIAAMAALMLPAIIEGHDSLAGIGATFAFFVWATAAAVRRRVRLVEDPRARVGRAGVVDPFAMALLMAVPYVVMGLGGHAHGGSSGGGSASSAVIPLSVLIIVGWAMARADGLRGPIADRVFYVVCLAMMVGMLVPMLGAAR